ncbi:hypothetical protein N9H93_02960 [Rhizobiaceae bacterium]|nr:hypothetical protein [Rhizobiaceae bacterium]
MAEADDKRLDRGRQVATVLVALGRDRAGRMLSRFTPEEIARLHAVSGAARGQARPNVTVSELDAVAQDFELTFRKGAGMLGAETAFAALLAAAAAAEAETRDDTEDPAIAERTGRWAAAAAMGDTALCAFLTEEDDRVAALVIARLGPERSASLLGALPKPSLDTLLRALAALNMPLESEDLVLDAIEDAADSGALKQDDKGRTDLLVSLVNALEPDKAEDVQKTLSETMPAAEWAKVEAGIFHFADLVTLSDTARAAVLADATTDRLVLALRGAEDALREAVLSALGPRLRRMVESDLEISSAPAGKPGDTARRAIAARAVALLKDGTIAREAVDG